MGYIAGVDEAGRGPVLGPLIVCMARCDRNDEKRLRKLGLKDSKQLSPEKREELYNALRSFVQFKWAEISAQELNTKMRDMSLNDIEAQAMASLIRSQKDCDVMIDLPDRYNWVFRQRMERFGASKFEAQHKADEMFPIVSAASICAKVVRDKRIAEIRSQTLDFGSGYPNDQKTRAALSDPASLKTLHPYVRSRWKTIDNLKQRKLFEGEPDGEDKDTQ